MKAYRIVTGMNCNYLGEATTEKAEYYFNKEIAEKRYAEGEYIYKVTRITTTFSDGSVSSCTTGADYYERERKRAKANEKVELVDEIHNRFRMEEIEIN